MTAKAPIRNSDRLAGLILNLLISAFFVSCLLTAWFAASGDPTGADWRHAQEMAGEALKYVWGMVEYIVTYPGIYLVTCIGLAGVLTAAGVGVSFMTWLREEGTKNSFSAINIATANGFLLGSGLPQRDAVDSTPSRTLRLPKYEPVLMP